MKYYKVIKENFLWEEGAILETNDSYSGYTSINEAFNKHKKVDDEYVSALIVEESPEYFERVYKVDMLTQVVYETRDKAKKLIQRNWKSK